MRRKVWNGIVEVLGAEAAEDVSVDTAQKVAMFAVSSVGCITGSRL